MKKILIFITVLSTLTTYLKAQQVWSKTFNMPTNVIAHSIAITPNNDFIVVGEYNYYNFGYFEDLYVAKLDQQGNMLWSKTHDLGYTYVTARDIQNTADGGFIVSGDINGNLLVLKLNAVGDTLWSRNYGGNYEEEGHSVKQSSDGGFAIGGMTYDVNFGLRDPYIVKVDSSGNFSWDGHWGANNYEYGYDLEVTQDNGFALAGFHNDNYNDAYLIKTDALGDTMWTKKYHLLGYDYAYTLEETQDAGFILGGSTKGGLASSDDQFFILKTNSTGQKLWHKIFYRPTSYNQVEDIEQTTDGGYAFIGSNQELMKTNSLGDSSWSIQLPYNYAYKDLEETADKGFVIVGETSTPFSSSFIVVKTDSLGNYSSITNIRNVSDSGFELELYPNPSSDILYIDQKSSQSTDVEILNSTGQKVLTTTIHQTVNSINIEHLPQGTYLFTSSTNQKPNPVYTFIKN